MKANLRHSRDIEMVLEGRRKRSRHDPLVPLINIVFLLLPFFLVASAFQGGGPVRLGSPDAKTQGAAKDTAIILNVEASGALRFNDKSMQYGEALAAMRDALAALSRKDLQIEADRKAPASIILPLLRKLRDSGVESIRLIAVKTGGVQ